MTVPALFLFLAADTVRVAGGDGAALRAALADPRASVVVVAGPGTFDGPFEISRPLALVGEGRPLLSGRGQGTVVRITAAGVRLAGFRIAGSGANLDRDDAGVRVEADSVTLDNLAITDVLHGVYLKQVDRVSITGVVIRGRASSRPNDRGDGIHFFYSTHVSARGNNIADVRDGMYFSYSDTTLVKGNTVARSRYGLHYMFSNANRFEDNRFTRSSAGTSIMNSRDVVVSGNVFAFNRGVESFGLLQQTTERVRLIRNVFVGNSVGLLFEGAVDGQVTENLVAGNFVGISLAQSATGNRFAGNVVTGNTYAASGGAPGSTFCSPGGGNYWGGRGWDLDGDGTFDVPFEGNSPLAELSRERPALRLFLSSPAASALAWAERTFPVFDIASVRDDCPLALRPASVPVPPSGNTPGGERPVFAAAAASLGLGLLILFGSAAGRT